MRHADDEEGDDESRAEKRGCEAGARMEVGGHVEILTVGWFIIRESWPSANFQATEVRSAL